MIDRHYAIQIKTFCCRTKREGGPGEAGGLIHILSVLSFVQKEAYEHVYMFMNNKFFLSSTNNMFDVGTKIQ